MTPGFLRCTSIHKPSRQQGKKQATIDSNICKTYQGHEDNSQPRLSRSGSRLGLSWTGLKAELHASKRMGKGTETHVRKLGDQVPLIGKLSRLFARKRS
ncbi:hypothetical protein BDW66DRAFT_125783, partial [Aspergillus desertorum]